MKPRAGIRGIKNGRSLPDERAAIFDQTFFGTSCRLVVHLNGVVMMHDMAMMDDVMNVVMRMVHNHNFGRGGTGGEAGQGPQCRQEQQRPKYVTGGQGWYGGSNGA